MLIQLLLLPFIGAIALLLFAKEVNAKRAALVISLLGFASTLGIAGIFNPLEGTQFLADWMWVQSLGIHFKIGMDGISLLLVLLTNFLVPIIILSSFNREYKNPKLFYSLILFMQMALIGVFIALDGFLFYIFWELALIPIYLICLMWGGADRVRITLKFFIYTLFGSLLMLVGLIYLYLQTPGAHTFDINAFYALHLSASEQTWLFWAFFLVFAIKMPVFPFHTWQPDTYTDAPTPGTMLLSGIMLKMGIYGVIRWLIPVVPEGVAKWGEVAMILSVIGIVYASCLAIVQKDLKRLIAYSSIAHVGLIAEGIFTMSKIGMQGAMIQMVSHGIVIVGLFYIIDIIIARTATQKMST